MNEQTLKNVYQEAYKEVMSNPLLLLWGNMTWEEKVRTLIDVERNLDIRRMME